MQEQAEIFIFYILHTEDSALLSALKASSWTNTRRLTWFNPPYSQSISINIGQKFLALFDHELRNVVNRNTVKASYSNMPNVVRNAKMWKKKKLRSGECSQTAFLTMH